MSEKHKVLTLLVSDVLADALLQNADNTRLRHALLDFLLVQVGVKPCGDADGGELNAGVLSLVEAEQNRFVERIIKDRESWREQWELRNPKRTPTELQKNSNGTPTELQKNSNGTPTELPKNSPLSVPVPVPEPLANARGARAKTPGTSSARMEPPSLEEVRAYADAEGLAMAAAEFVDFYAAKGWKVGSQAMKDWRAAARNWARREADFKAKQPANPATTIAGANNVARFKGAF